MLSPWVAFKRVTGAWGAPWIVGTVLIGLILIPLSRGIVSPAPPMDEGIPLLYPELVLKGHLPYRDFESVYGPGDILVLAAAYAVGGPSIEIERGVGLLYRCLILAAIFITATRWGTGLATCCATISGILLNCTGATAYAWIAAVAFGLVSLSVLGSGDTLWRAFVGGLLAGLSLLCRPDIVIAVGLGALPLIIVFARSRRWTYLAGIAAGMLPLLVICIVVGAERVIANLFILTVVVTRSARFLPLGTVKPYLVGLLVLHLAACGVNVFAGVVTSLKERDNRRGRLLLGAALFGLGISYQAFQRLDFIHIMFTIFVSVGLLPLAISVLLRWRIPSVSLRMLPFMAVTVVLVVLQLIAPDLSRYFLRQAAASFGLESRIAPPRITELVLYGRPGVFVAINGRTFPFLNIEEAQSAKEMLLALDRETRPGQRLFVGPHDLRHAIYTDTYIYYLMDSLEPATYFLEMNPGSANAPGSRLAADVASADWLVLNRAYDAWTEPNQSSAPGGSAPNEVVQQQFEREGVYGNYEIYRNKRLRNLPGS